ncbi:MAG: HPF/RaiA family ribosome-associated protein [Bacteroidota bacterium]|nr:HPF/RaiA family ribosome-associated protein [Bacteroidota bacterium]MDP3145666.1 HPF/RaiA family ribosome-associated protein [Bacteroidota bacterium]MDP3558660.1 HPF/RaiA family ribosome-associated protein [Bacteroidota bacterium]
MITTIQTLDFTPKQNLTDFLNQKMEKLTHWDNRIIKADVILLAEDKKDLLNKTCEIKLNLKGKQLFVKTKSASFEKSILNTIEILKKRLRTQKTKSLKFSNKVFK